MSVALHRAALVAMLQRVPDVGRVHEYERYLREEARMQELYVWAAPGGMPHVRGWYVGNCRTRRRTLGLGRVLLRHTWPIRGFLVLNDEERSSIVFDDLCEAIGAEHEADRTLGGVSTAEELGSDVDGVQKLEAGPALFCGVLCHSALLQLETWEYTR